MELSPVNRTIRFLVTMVPVIRHLMQVMSVVLKLGSHIRIHKSVLCNHVTLRTSPFKLTFLTNTQTLLILIDLKSTPNTLNVAVCHQEEKILSLSALTTSDSQLERTGLRILTVTLRRRMRKRQLAQASLRPTMIMMTMNTKASILTKLILPEHRARRS